MIYFCHDNISNTAKLPSLIHVKINPGSLAFVGVCCYRLERAELKYNIIQARKHWRAIMRNARFKTKTVFKPPETHKRYVLTLWFKEKSLNFDFTELLANEIFGFSTSLHCIKNSPNIFILFLTCFRNPPTRFSTRLKPSTYLKPVTSTLTTTEIFFF